MPWLLFAAVLIPPMARQVERARHFLLAVVISAVLGSCIAALLPAVGPWAGYHFEPYWPQAWEAREIASLRGPGIFTANPDYKSGLITFPSFHVALAILSVFALYPFRWLRYVALLAAVLIAVATVSTGWHYASDVIGGAAISAIGIAIAGRIN
jgi:membrane-associated phospholipid phosphatase